MAKLTSPEAEPFEYVVTIEPIPADEERVVVATLPAFWGAITVVAEDGRMTEAHWHRDADGHTVVTMGRHVE